MLFMKFAYITGIDHMILFQKNMCDLCETAFVFPKDICLTKERNKNII